MIRTLAKEMERLSVQVILRADVKQILTEDLETPDDGARESKSAGPARKICGLVFDTQTERGKKFWCDALILATGGVSYPSTGSDGSGFELLKPLGHTCTRLRPSLIGMRTKESYIPGLQGLAPEKYFFYGKVGEKGFI